MKTKITSEINTFLNKYTKSYKELNKIKILFILFSIFLTYFISKNIFEPFNFYYDYKWLDIPMHMLGGFLFANLFLETINNKYINFRNLLFFTLFIGISWELLEYALDITNLKSFVGWFDTFKDLFDDILGAYLAFLFYKNK